MMRRSNLLGDVAASAIMLDYLLTSRRAPLECGVCKGGEMLTEFNRIGFRIFGVASQRFQSICFT